MRSLGFGFLCILVTVVNPVAGVLLAATAAEDNGAGAYRDSNNDF